jgi:hypothetical protein
VFVQIYKCKREGRNEGKTFRIERGLHFALLKHRIFAFSRELTSAVSMLFRLIKENEL